MLRNSPEAVSSSIRSLWTLTTRSASPGGSALQVAGLLKISTTYFIMSSFSHRAWTSGHRGIGPQKGRGREPMLGDHPIHPVLLAKDLAATREFYHDKVGLEILMENDDAIVFRCGNGTQLDVTKSTVGTADEQTQVSWEVPDLRAEVAELRSRGVKVEDYDMPGLKTEDGIADLGFALFAWIIDPGKNALGIMQPKG